MLAKFLIILALIFIIGSLGSALIYLLSHKDGGQRTYQALTWRIALSIGLFICLIIAGKLGIIQPNSLGQSSTPVVSNKP